MTRYWSDDAYAQFYRSSDAEKNIIARRGSASGSTGAAGAGSDGDGLWRPTAAQLEDFQRAFAEWSSGRGGLRQQDFRPFLAQVDIELTPAQCRSLWQDLVLEGDNEGWTLVQRLSNGEEGFVPSSFLVIS